MAGETIKTEAICLRIVPWSQTSHIVLWLTPNGKVSTVVKGAVRSKSAFLGQYDLNYTCEIVYYARSKGELHALRECAPLLLREGLRNDYRALIFADYARSIIGELSPEGPEALEWFNLLSNTLNRVANYTCETLARERVVDLIKFELNTLHLSGLSPDVEAEGGIFHLRGERTLPIRAEVARVLRRPDSNFNTDTPLYEALRALGIFISFHLDCAIESRRILIKITPITD